MKRLIELDDVSAGYDGKTVLHNISLQIGEKDFVGITGPNGGGKTTLIKVLLGLIRPTSGVVRRFGEGEQLRLGYLPQINGIDRNFPISVREVLLSGLLSPANRWKVRSEQKKRVEEVLSLVGMEEAADRPIGELSGGQLQRILLGRAIAAEPQLLVLDEPESHLDKSFEERFPALLREVSRQSAVVLVSHSLARVTPLLQTTLFIEGTIVRQTPAEMP
jgi:zinc transport system ATP-binding protein